MKKTTAAKKPAAKKPATAKKATAPRKTAAPAKALAAPAPQPTPAAAAPTETCPRCGTGKFAPEQRIRAEGSRTVRYTVLVCERGHTFARPRPR